MKNMKYIGLLLGISLVYSACKYEEGPWVSIRSKKERVSNTWKVEKAYEDGQDVTSSYQQYELQLLRSGSAKLVAIYTSGNVTVEYETNGTWDLIDNKEELRLDFENNNADNTYKILKLKEKEMWLRDTDDDVELHLMPK